METKQSFKSWVMDEQEKAEIARKIETYHAYPPIPDRSNDWCAYPKGQAEDGPFGWGKTEEEAIDDLISNHEVF